MLIAGSLASAPLVATADSSSDPVTVTTDQGDNKNISVTVKDNGDGSKTVSVTMPKNQVIGDADSKGNSFTAKTDPSRDSKTDVDKGKVTVKGDNAKFNLELDSSAINNTDLMNMPLQIDISDAQGKHIGKISNVTLNQLLKQAQKEQSSSDVSKTESSSSSLSRDRDVSSTANSSDSESSQSNSSTQPSNTSAQASSGQSANSAASNNDDQTAHPQTYNSVADLVAAIKKNGAGAVRGSSVIVTPSNVVIDDDGTSFDGGNGTMFTSADKYDSNLVKTGQPVEVTVEAVDGRSEFGKDSGDFLYDIEFSNARTPESNGQNNGQNNSQTNDGQNAGQNNGQGSGQNSSIPQTGDNHSILGAIAGGISAGLEMFGELFTKKLF